MSSGFPGAALSFGASGDGVAIDPETGQLRIATDRLRDGVTVTVTGADSGGAARLGFRLTIAAAPLVAPALIVAPVLSGAGTIGLAVTAAPGEWSGDPAPELAYAWFRNGVAIAGATGAAYVPVPEDDGAALTVRVTARNAAGSAVAATAPTAVAYAAPVVAGLADRRFEQGSGVQAIDAAAAFTGASLRFTVAGGGATVDPATGLVSIPTETPLADALVTVTAGNSGGSAMASFRLAVLPAFPAALAATLWSAVELRAAAPAGRLRVALDADAPVPAGFELRLQAGGAAGGVPGPDAPVLAPGGSVVTDAAAIGSTRHLRLFWRRHADGAQVPASEGGIALQILGLFLPPLALAAPALAGTGAIGSAVSVAPGLWAGDPAPEFAYAWCRNGAAIAGATGATYSPGPADDLAGLSCRVTATNVAGSATAETAMLSVAYPAPTLVAEIPEEIFDEDSGAQAVPTAFAFAGANLSFAVSGEGATIDPVTGIVAIATDLPRSATITVTAANSGGAVQGAFQVTVEAIEPGFSVPASLWTATHDIDRAVGQRLISVDPAVLVPAGHALKLYSSTEPGGQATAKSATITPGLLYQTGKALSLGAICYNSLWLHRIADGAILPASENEISFPISDKVALVVPAADASVASLAELAAKLDEWASGWDATLPAGRSATADRYIDIVSGDYGVLVLTGLAFPGRVHIRSADRDQLGARFTRIKVSNCARLDLEFLTQKHTAFHSARTGAVEFVDCTDCSFGYGQNIGPADLLADGKCFGALFERCTDCSYRHNLNLNWPVGVSIQGSTRFRLEDNVFDYMKGDDTKVGGGADIYFSRNWGSLTKRLFDPGDHTDYNQDQTDPSNDQNGTALRDGYYAEGHIIYQKTLGERSFQGWYLGGNGIRKNFRVNNSIIICNNGCVKFKYSALTGDPSNGVTNTTAMIPAPARMSGLAMGQAYLDHMGGTNANNIVSRLGSGNEGAGTDGIYIECGPNLAGQNYTAQHAYYVGPIQMAPSPKSPIHELMPVEGSPAHWDHPTPKGGFARLRDIVVNGIHPGNSPNPALAAHWRAAWNWDGFVIS